MELSIEEHKTLVELAQKVIRGKRRREDERIKKEQESEEHYKELRERGTFKEEPVYVCSFCGKDSKEVKKLIMGPDVFICDECVKLCNEIFEQELLRPKDEEKVCEYCGNDEAVKTLCGHCRM